MDRTGTVFTLSSCWGTMVMERSGLRNRTMTSMAAHVSLIVGHRPKRVVQPGPAGDSDKRVDVAKLCTSACVLSPGTKRCNNDLGGLGQRPLCDWTLHGVSSHYNVCRLSAMTWADFFGVVGASTFGRSRDVSGAA